mmetsp:Transcript_52081/g.113410  ORF Transcript_52081/g.113410 Transcript_52081/m.113410 type:complete len:238 (+) Transcript_52081:752-1465(+)
MTEISLRETPVGILDSTYAMMLSLESGKRTRSARLAPPPPLLAAGLITSFTTSSRGGGGVDGGGEGGDGESGGGGDGGGDGDGGGGNGGGDGGGGESGGGGGGLHGTAAAAAAHPEVAPVSGSSEQPRSGFPGCREQIAVPGTLLNDAGMRPVRKLMSSRRRDNCVSLPNCGGMVPLKPLSRRFNDEHRSSFPKWRGRAPVNLFEETHSVFKFESSPICGGMVPLISLFWKNLQRKQ